MSKFSLVCAVSLLATVCTPPTFAGASPFGFNQTAGRAAPYIQDWSKATTACRTAPQAQAVVLPQMGFAQPPAGQAAMPRSGDYYLEELAHGALRWNHREISVCIEKGGIGYKNSYAEVFLDSLREWTKASGGLLRFYQEPYSQAADITCDWLSRSPAAGEAGNTQIAFRYFSGRRLLAHAHIDIAALVNGRQVSDNEMKKTCLHELGHALGLVHTSCPFDIMYYRSNKAQGTLLSGRDGLTIKRLYGQS